MLPLINIHMSFENVKLTLKDVIQIFGFVITITLCFTAQSSKIDNLIVAVSEMKTSKKESDAESKLNTQSITNQVNANTIQIKILEQDIKMLKDNMYKRQGAN